MKSGSPPCPDRLPGGRLEFNPSRHAIPDCCLVCLGGTAADVRTIGRVAEERLPSGNVRYYLDFGRVKGLGRVRIYGGFKTREDAAAVLAHIQGEIVREGKRGVSLADVLSRRVPQGSVPRQVQTRLAA